MICVNTRVGKLTTDREPAESLDLGDSMLRRSGKTSVAIKATSRIDRGGVLPYEEARDSRRREAYASLAAPT